MEKGFGESGHDYSHLLVYIFWAFWLIFVLHISGRVTEQFENTMVLTMTHTSLLIGTLGAISFIFGIVAENKKVIFIYIFFFVKDKNKILFILLPLYLSIQVSSPFFFIEEFRFLYSSCLLRGFWGCMFV